MSKPPCPVGKGATSKFLYWYAAIAECKSQREGQSRKQEYSLLNYFCWTQLGTCFLEFLIDLRGMFPQIAFLMLKL